MRWWWQKRGERLGILYFGYWALWVAGIYIWEDAARKFIEWAGFYEWILLNSIVGFGVCYLIEEVVGHFQAPPSP